MNSLTLELSAPEAKEAFADVQPGDEIECVVRGVVKEVGENLVIDPITSYEYEGYEYELDTSMEEPEMPMPMEKGGGMMGGGGRKGGMGKGGGMVVMMGSGEGE